jgi:hypothetical protein
VRDRINRILPLLPRTITQPTIEKQDPDAAPILTIAITAKKPIREVTEYTDKVLRRRLESADGVGQVLVLGGRKRQINVWGRCRSSSRLQPDSERRPPARCRHRTPTSGRAHRSGRAVESRCGPAAASTRPNSSVIW